MVNEESEPFQWRFIKVLTMHSRNEHSAKSYFRAYGNSLLA